MCHFTLPIEAIETAHLIDFKSYFKTELAELAMMEKEGLITLDDQWITVNPPGRLLVRAIAMVFARYLRFDSERLRYSKVI
jgi:oxygen-independent coproporphyrinogen-3 oxidase